MSKDYRIVAKIRNNRILTLIEAAGFQSAYAFCKARGLHYSVIAQLIAMKAAPKGRRGEWLKSTIDLATALRMQPEDLFNARQMRGGNTTTITREVDETELSLESTSIADRLLASPDSAVTARVDVDRLMERLSPRQRRVVELSYGLNGQGEATLREVGDELGVGPERVRQILAVAVRRMKHPDNCAGEYLHG